MTEPQRGEAEGRADAAEPAVSHPGSVRRLGYEGGEPMLRTVITGVTGRMGSTLLRLARSTPGLAVVGATARQGSPAVGQDAAPPPASPIRSGWRWWMTWARRIDAGAQVVIDFTSAEASVAHARLCAARGVPMVIGSTGFSPEHARGGGRRGRVHPRGAGAEHLGGRQRRHPDGGRAGPRAGRGLRRRGPRDAPPHEEGRALGHGAAAGRGARPGAGPHQRGLSSSRARAGWARAPRREIGVQTLRGGDVVGEHTVYLLR